MPSTADPQRVKRALSALFSVYNRDGDTFNLASRHEGKISEFINEYLKARPQYEFIGLAHQAQSRSHLTVDQPIPAFWVADSATAVWGAAITTAATTTNVYPTTTTRIRQDGNIVWWEYVFGWLDVSVNNSVLLIDYADINGSARGIQRPLIQSRTGGLKILEIDPGIMIEDAGTKNIDMQAENTGPASAFQVLPLAVEIVPFEIATSQDVTAYVVDNA